MRLAWFFALLLTLTGCATIPPGAVTSAREVTALSDGWHFVYRDGWTPEQALASASGEWAEVTFPHSWNRLGEYRETRGAATDNRQGTGWYRRIIAGSSLDPAKRHFVEFDAVGNVADVWLNGRHLGRHAGAFTRFRLELNPALDFTGDNTLLVRADNSDPQPGSSTQDVIPLLGDFFVHGGVYRPARLVSVPSSHIALDDFGGPGVYATPHLQPDGSARVDVLVRLTAPSAGQRVRVVVNDARGQRVAVAEQAVASGQREIRFALPIARPRLWNGRNDPYLYAMTATLKRGSATLDRVDQTLGIRSFRMDADAGFFLNGKPLQLRGVSRHQDRLGKGWALNEADEEQDMALIAEMGANSVRAAHYPQSTRWFDLADRYGMVVWAEVPFVNKVSFGGAGTPALTGNARLQMTEMIRQYFNHPSIVTWGIGNEVDLDIALGRIPAAADPVPLLRELHSVAKREDPSRPTTYADCCEATPNERVKGLQRLTGLADLAGYNRYYGWYYGKVGELGPHLDLLHARHPRVPLSVSEYGVGGALSQHSSHPEGRPTDSGGRPQPEEFESWWHEASWTQIRARPYLWGSWIWNMFDFSSRVRKEGDATDVNTKGLVSFDRKVKKDAFYYYKSQWSAEPVVHITSRRFNPRSEPVTRIKVYSNAPSVILTHNGMSLGEVACWDRVCVLEGVRLAPGTNRVTARAMFGSEAASDAVEWILTE